VAVDPFGDGQPETAIAAGFFGTPPSHRFLIMEESQVMRRLILSALLGVAVAGNVGCFLPIYSGDPLKRTDQLIFTSEDMRNILLEWERFWLLDQPSHMTPYRVHGGVI